MRRFFLNALLLSFILPACYAQSKLKDNMFLKKLPNGLDVLVVEDNSVPLATLMLTVKSGSITESENTNGLTALYQNMLTRGNKVAGNHSEFDYHGGELGIQSCNSMTEFEYGDYFFTLPKSNLEQGLNYLNSAVRFANMNPEDLESEKVIHDAQLKEKQSGPYYALAEAMAHHLWGQGFSRKNPGGSTAVISAATTSVLIDSIKNKYYYPDNALLVIGGDVAHEMVFTLAEKIYGDWKPSGFDPLKKWPVPEFQRLAKSDYFVVESSQSRNPLIMINWQGPDTRNDLPATFAADVFSYIVNKKMSAFNERLVQSGLAYQTNFSYLTLKHVGPISLIVVPNPSRMKECLNEVKKQISLMDSDDYLSADQIESAKRALEIQQIREEDITSDYVHSLSFWWASASLKYFLGYYDNLNRVSKSDIKTYVQKYIKNKPYCAGLSISPELSLEIKPETFFTPGN
jgi:zinc protease